jgi:hypothetical protein
MRRGHIALLVGLVALGACHKPRTEIVLTVDSNLSVPAELDQVHIVVASEKTATRFDQTYDLGPGKTKLPIVLGLVPESDKSLAFRAVADGLKGGVVVVERSAVTSFVPDQTLALFLDLLRVCVRATCSSGETCGPQGTCVPESIQPADLPRYGAARDAGIGPGLDGGWVYDAVLADAHGGMDSASDSNPAPDHPAADLEPATAEVTDPAPDGSSADGWVDAPAAAGLDSVSEATTTTPDATPEVSDTSSSMPDTRPDSVPVMPEVEPDSAPDLQPDLRTPDVLPGPDVAPECPYVSWMTIDSEGWSLTLKIPLEAMCFTICSVMTPSLDLSQLPGRSVEINGVPAESEPRSKNNWMPSGLPPISTFLYVFRVGSGPTGVLVLDDGTPFNFSTGACP